MGSASSKQPAEPSKGQSGRVKHRPHPAAAAHPHPRGETDPAATAEAKADTAASSAALEERVRRFYDHYNPEKVATVPTVLRKWKGTAESLMQTLVERYGPEPTAVAGDAETTTMPPSKEEVANMWAPRFARHLLSYRPEKLSRLRSMLKRAEGKEEAMLQSLIEQLGPEPAGPLPECVPDTMLVAPKEGVQEVYDNPQPAVEVSTELNDTHITSQDTAVENVVSVESHTVMPMHSFRRRLSSFFGVRAPEKLSTLEECLRQYVEDEEGLFTSLRETYGTEPTEEETQAYFVQRLEGLYACYAPSRVSSAASEIAVQYGKEEEFLQAVANEFGADSMMMMMQSPAETHPHPCEYTDAEERELEDTTPREAHSAEQQNKHLQEMEKENEEPVEVQQGVEVSQPENQINKTTLPTTNVPVSNTETFATTAPTQLKTTSATEDTINHVPEGFRCIVEGQQQKLTALQAGINHLRNIMEGEFQTHTQKDSFSSPGTVTVKDQVEYAGVPFSPYPSPRSPYTIQRPENVSCGINKSISLDRHVYRHDSTDGFLPPPPMLRPPRDGSSPLLQPAVKTPSLFVFRCSSSPKQVRTLSEMRLEYEREREGIRSAEKRLQPCRVMQ